ncbi:kinase-like domain-containing protein [Hypoxylon sp. FL1857]|nr:kinase-like domain-containing protein [Hypoxylon sp. FL1857]
MRLARGIFTESDSKLVILQIINAIHYLHEGQIAHRDLKPENVLFATGPHATGRIIVGDLGFARSTASGRMVSRVGTNQYMAPEIEYGQRHDLAVDIWSLGMITVFLVAPDHHVVPNRFMKLSQAVIDEWLDSVFEDTSHQDISNNCQSFIRLCLMYQPERRMEASEAKHHPWFQQQADKKRFNFHMKENVETWKPNYLIAPPCQELPDLENTGNTTKLEQQEGISRSSTSATKSSKRKPTAADPSSQESPYFVGPQSIASKRLKTL